MGCTQGVISLNPEARSIKVVTNKQSNCKYLGEVYGYQSSLSLESEVAQSAINGAKNEAYKLGDDIIHFLSNHSKIHHIFLVMAGL